MAQKSGLGRGLNSLFAENASDSGEVVTLRLSEIEPNRDQPRKNFDENSLAELAASIEKHGLLQPLLVRPLPGGRYGLIAGERRWRACRMAGLSKVSAVVREIDDDRLMELALIENLQREDLDPIEEAEGYRTLIEKFSLTQEQVAESVGKSRPAVANALRLLQLNDDERAALLAGEITVGHARALLSIADKKLRADALRMAREGATVRMIEQMGHEKPRRQKNPRRLPKSYSEVALSLQQSLGRRVKITQSGKVGFLQLEFYSEDELFDYARRIGDK